MKGKINIKEILNILNENDTHWIGIPTNFELDSDFDTSCMYLIYITETDGLLDLEYSENGVDFNILSDWYVLVNKNGKIKGKGSTKHKEQILKTLDCIVEIVKNEKYLKYIGIYPVTF